MVVSFRDAIILTTITEVPPELMFNFSVIEADNIAVFRVALQD